VSEAYSESFQPEPPEPAGQLAGEAASAAPHDAGDESTSADNPDGDRGDALGDDRAGSDAGTPLAAEELHPPEHQDRQEAASATWDDATAPGDDDQGPFSGDLASEYDGDVAALLAEEQRLPDPATRQEATPATPDDGAAPGDDEPWTYSGDPASEYDGDVAALLAEEQRLPDPSTRQEAEASTGDDTATSQDTAPDTSTDGTHPSQPDASAELPVPPDEGDDATPDPLEYQIAVPSTDGAGVPLTIEYLPPEARTIGDTTPTGIGRKPTGEDFLDMESDDPVKRRIDRLFDEALKDGDDFSDSAGSMGAAFEADLHSGSGPSGHPAFYHAAAAGSAQDHPAWSDQGVSDAASSMAIVVVMAAFAIRHALSELAKEQKP
jgi:hypothetical protein